MHALLSQHSLTQQEGGLHVSTHLKMDLALSWSILTAEAALSLAWCVCVCMSVRK